LHTFYLGVFGRVNVVNCNELEEIQYELSKEFYTRFWKLNNHLHRTCENLHDYADVQDDGEQYSNLLAGEYQENNQGEFHKSVECNEEARANLVPLGKVLCELQEEPKDQLNTINDRWPGIPCLQCSQ